MLYKFFIAQHGEMKIIMLNCMEMNIIKNIFTAILPFNNKPTISQRRTKEGNEGTISLYSNWEM